MRPPNALGLLQLCQRRIPLWEVPARVILPRVLETDGKTRFAWKPPLEASSLAEADIILRKQMQIPLGVRVPLLRE